MGGSAGSFFSSIGNNTSVLQKAVNLDTLGAATAVTAPGREAAASQKALSDAGTAQAAQAANLEQLTLQQPKNISPDNFLASKTNALANLRLGLASTITGAGGAPSPVLSAPSLTGNGPGKTKLGS